MDRARDNLVWGARGFTLVELLVVIAILGMLSGVVVFAVGNLTANGGSASCAADARTITSAEEAYRAVNGNYVSEAALVAGGQLRDNSSLHDVALSGGAYTIVDVGRCDNSSASGSSGSGSSGSGLSGGITVKLLSSSGAGLPGAQVEYLDGSWISIGTTGSDGSATSALPNGTYQFRVDYRGGSKTLPPTAVTTAAPFVVHTVAVSLGLTGGAGDHSGAAIAHLGSDGFWMTDDSTDSGGASALELLAGTYTFRADYHGQTNLSAPIVVAGATTSTFPLTTVTVDTGQPTVPVEHRGNNGEWIDDGATNSGGTATFDALAGTYTVRAHLQGGSVPQSDATVSGATTTVNVP